MAANEPVMLHVEGMDCNNCALGITRKLKKIGLEQVNVDFATGEVLFTPESGIGDTEVRSAIESIGYHVVDVVEETTGMSNLEKKFWFCAVLTLPLFLTMFTPDHWILHNPYVQLGICIPVFGVGLYHFGKSAIGSLKTGIANMDVLILIGSTAAFGYSLAGMLLYDDPAVVHQYLFFETTATIITLVLLGNVLEHRSIKQTTTAVRELAKLQEVNARRVVMINGMEELEEVPASQIRKGDILQVNEGDAIPCDGKLLGADALVDESMITGESEPVSKTTEATLIGGTINAGSTFRVEATAIGSETVLSGIIRLVKQAQADKPPIQKLSDKIAAIFVPVVVGIAVLTFFLAWKAFDVSLQQSLMQAIAVLVISCPCAMGLAIPTAVIAGVGRAAKNGILIRGGSTLESFKKVKYMVFDKTGTLTTGKFKLAKLDLVGTTEEARIKSIVLELEQQSSHPIAKSIVKELKTSHPELGSGSHATLTQVSEVKGIGMRGTDQAGKTWQLGSYRLLDEPRQGDLFLVCDNVLQAVISLEDEIKTEAGALIKWLKSEGITPVMLSGDRKEKCEQVASKIGIEKIYAEQLPENKLALIEQMSGEGRTIMVGDGINDAPALAKADAGISLGDATQVAMQQAQVILLKGDALLHIKTTLQIGGLTMKTIKQNLFWAFFYNVLAIPIAAVGLLNPMIAALAMAFSDIVVIGNSIRLKIRKLR